MDRSQMHSPTDRRPRFPFHLTCSDRLDEAGLLPMRLAVGRRLRGSWFPAALVLGILGLLGTPVGAQSLIRSETQQVFPSDSYFLMAQGLAVHGDWAAFSTRAESRAVFYRRTAVGWREVQIIQGPLSLNFGYSLDLDGDLCIVGAPKWSEQGFRMGAAFIYQRSGSTWTQVQEFKPVLVESASFGLGVAIDAESGTAAMSGAMVEGHPSPYTPGAVYIHERQADGSWPLTFEFALPWNRAVADYEHHALGVSLAMDGNTVVAGASSGRFGAVYVFERDASGAWDLATVLEDETPIDNDEFGDSVAVRGDLIVVGEPKNGDRKGSAFVYRRTAGTWQLENEIGSSDGVGGMNSSDNFGESVAVDVSPRRVVVGANNSFTAGPHSGTAYVFEPTGPGGAWQETTRLIPSVPTGQGLGRKVALGGGCVLATAPHVLDPDSFYTFELQTGEPYCIDASGTQPILEVSGQAPEHRVALRSYATAGQAIVAFSLSTAQVPFGQGTLCLAVPQRRIATLSLSPTGIAYMDLPDLSVVPAGQLYLQAVLQGPGGPMPSNGVVLTAPF